MSLKSLIQFNYYESGSKDSTGIPLCASPEKVCVHTKHVYKELDHKFTGPVDLQEEWREAVVFSFPV